MSLCCLPFRNTIGVFFVSSPLCFALQQLLRRRDISKETRPLQILIHLQIKSNVLRTLYSVPASHNFYINSESVVATELRMEVQQVLIPFLSGAREIFFPLLRKGQIA